MCVCVCVCVCVCHCVCVYTSPCSHTCLRFLPDRGHVLPRVSGCACLGAWSCERRPAQNCLGLWTGKRPMVSIQRNLYCSNHAIGLGTKSKQGAT